jgi:Fe-S-cluster-containing dehydrogenase component
MFALDRETAILVGVVVCIAASVYMYRELKNSKQDITKITTFLDKVQEEEQAYMKKQQEQVQAMRARAETQQKTQPTTSPTAAKTPEKRVTRGQSPVNISSE